MIIAINGDLIDVSKIYRITDIVSDDGYVDEIKPIVLVEGVVVHFDFHFRILFLNGPEKYVNINRTVNLVVNEINDETFNDFKKLKEFKVFYDEVSQFRDAIVDVWSKNQSTIPQFNI